MNAIWNTFFGPSWLTSLLGYVGAAYVALAAILPANGDFSHVNWSQVGIAVVIAIGGRAAKMTGVSNSPTPLAEAKPVVASEVVVPTTK